MRWMTRMLAVGLVAFVYPLDARATDVVNIAVDATDAGTELKRVWPFHGYDEVNYSTVPEGEALLGVLAAAHTAPVRVRSHFLLNTGDGVPALKWGSTNIYNEDADGNPVYSWGLTDGILDAITSVGAFPFVEIGFMPEALSIHPTPYRNTITTSLDGGCFYPATNDDKWAALIREWAAHANARYPGVEKNWLWELWNEPDIGYWHGTFADYAKLYDYTESALHKVLPQAALGGPAVAHADGTFLPQFLEHCATGTNAVTGDTGTRLDLVSFHAKGGVAISNGHVQMDLGNQLRLHRAGFEAVAAVSQLRRTPIYITEADPEGCAACLATIWPEDAYRNSPAYGAYEIAMMKHTIELAASVGVQLNGILTWAFTFPGTPYFAGYRALSTNGIGLPVLSAFKLLGRLDGIRVPLTSTGARALDDILAHGVREQPDVDGIATRNGTGVQVLLWNYHDDLVATDETPVHLDIKVPASSGTVLRVSHLRVDDTHGDAYAVWVSQGMPASPSDAQVAELRNAMDPSAAAFDGATLAVPANGVVALEFDLPRFGVSLVSLDPLTSADGSGVGISADAGPTQAREGGGGCGCDLGARRHGHADVATVFLLGCVLGGAMAWSRRSARG
jgi:xylan 1,4-beta-xylosidase